MTRAAGGRCQGLIPTPGVTGPLLRCIKPGTHWWRIEGCGCPDRDPEVCKDGFAIWICDGPHNAGA